MKEEVTAKKISDKELNRTAREVRYQLYDYLGKLVPNMVRPEIKFDENTGILTVYRSRI